MTRCESIWCIWSYLNKTKRPHEWFLLQPKLFVLFWIPVVPPKRKSFTYIFIKKPRLHFLADGFVPLVVSWDAYSFSVHSVESWAPDCSVALGFGFAHCVWWSQINRGSINHVWKPLTSTFYLFLQKKINVKFDEFSPQLYSIRARVKWWLGLELSWTICSKRLLISFNDILPPNEWLRGATETWLSVSGRSLCDEGGPDLSVWWTIYPCSGNNWQRWQRWGY